MADACAVPCSRAAHRGARHCFASTAANSALIRAASRCETIRKANWSPRRGSPRRVRGRPSRSRGCSRTRAPASGHRVRTRRSWKSARRPGVGQVARRRRAARRDGQRVAPASAVAVVRDHAHPAPYVSGELDPVQPDRTLLAGAECPGRTPDAYRGVDGPYDSAVLECVVPLGEREPLCPRGGRSVGGRLRGRGAAGRPGGEGGAAHDRTAQRQARGSTHDRRCPFGEKVLDERTGGNPRIG